MEGQKSIKKHGVALFKNVSVNKEKQEEVEKMRKIALLLVLLMANIVLLNAQDNPTENILTALNSLYCFLMTSLPIFAAVLVIFAAVIFAAGQVMGAETRARANVWATAMLTGSLIGFAVAIIVPWFITTLWGNYDEPSC